MATIGAITVEPTLFLFVFGFFFTQTTESDFFMQTACRVHLNYSDDICNNLLAIENKQNQRNVQLMVTSFNVLRNITRHFFPIVLSLFLGEWSDKYGRKLPLIAGLLGKLYYSIMVMVIYTKKWSLEHVLLLAILPSSLTGTDSAIFASAFAYVADVSSIKQRTFRMAVLQATYLAAMPIAQFCATYYFQYVIGDPVYKMFLINITCCSMAVLYTILHLNPYSRPDHKHNNQTAKGWTKLLDFFQVDWKNMFSIFKSNSKLNVAAAAAAAADTDEHESTGAQCINNRKFRRHRCYILMICAAMFFYVFSRAERQYMYLYTMRRFRWTNPDFTFFSAMRSSGFAVVLIVVLPVMTQILHFGDFTIAYIGSMMHVVFHFGLYFALTTTQFYVCGLLTTFGVVMAPIIRSIGSKLVPERHRGKLFALLAMSESLSTLCNHYIYKTAYNCSEYMDASYIFLVTVSTQMLVLTLISIIFITNKNLEEFADGSRRQSVSDDDPVPLRTLTLSNEIEQRVALSPEMLDLPAADGGDGSGTTMNGGGRIPIDVHASDTGGMTLADITSSYVRHSDPNMICQSIKTYPPETFIATTETNNKKNMQHRTATVTVNRHQQTSPPAYLDAMDALRVL